VSETSADTYDLFETRAGDYGVELTRVEPSEAPEAITAAVEEPAVGAPLPWEDVSLPSSVPTDPTPAQLEAAVTGVSGAELAVADYGSIVLRQDASGSENQTATGITTLKYDIQLSGGTRIRAPLMGVTAEEVRFGGDDPSTVESAVASELDGWSPESEPPGPMHAYLRGRDATVERIAGGMVGRPLVTLRTHERLVSFFTARGDDRRAGLFRDLRAETAAVLDDGISLLETRCASDSAWETARLVATYTIRLAGDDTADALRGL